MDVWMELVGLGKPFQINYEKEGWGEFEGKMMFTIYLEPFQHYEEFDYSAMGKGFTLPAAFSELKWNMERDA